MQGMRHTMLQQNVIKILMSLARLDLECAFSGGYAESPNVCILEFGTADYHLINHAVISTDSDNSPMEIFAGGHVQFLYV